MREALFSILGEVEGLAVLDLFSGSGALALEALSRGARRAVLVESDALAARALRDNLARLAPAASARVVVAALPGALATVASSEPPFDLVLADPPYAGTLGRETLAHPDLARCMTADALVVLEHAVGMGVDPEPPGLRCIDERRYGSTGLSMYRRAAPAREDERPEDPSP